MISSFGCNLDGRYGLIELGGSNHSFVGASDIIWVYFRNSKIKLSVFKSFTISFTGLHVCLFLCVYSLLFFSM